MKRREYWLSDEKGRIYWLDGTDGVELVSVTGLGVKLKRNYSEITDGFHASTGGGREEQEPICGTLCFYGPRPYEDQKRFVKWLFRAGTLYFNYSPTAEWYRRRVELSYLTKDGKLPHGMLSVPAAFDPLTPWYRVQEKRLTMSEAEEGAFRCDEGVLDEDVLSEEALVSSAAEATAEGQRSSAFTLVYTGAITAPVITLEGAESGTLYGRCAINAAMLPGETLEYSTEPSDRHAYRRRAGGEVVDLLDRIDPGCLSGEPFPAIPADEPCILRLASAQDFAGSAVAVLRHYERMV